MIHKHKESDGRKIFFLKRDSSQFKCFVPKRTRSCHFIQSYPASGTTTAQFTPSVLHASPPSPPNPADVATGCQHIYTSHARPAPPTPLCMSRQVHVHSHTFLHGHYMHNIHTHRWSLEGAVKICSDLVRRHGTRHACNVQCHDNSDNTQNCPSPLFSPPGSC